MGCGMSTEYQEDEREKKGYPYCYPYTTKATMSGEISTEFDGDEKDALVPRGSPYTFRWQPESLDEPKPEPISPSQKKTNLRQHESMSEPKREPKPQPISPAASQYTLPSHYEPTYEPPHEPKLQPKPQLSVHSLKTNNTWQHEPEPWPPIPNLKTSSTWHYEPIHEPMYEPRPQPQVPPGSQYTSSWQQESEYESMPKPEPQPIILTQETDYTYGVTLSTHCTACHLKKQGSKCSDQSGKAWMLARLVAVSPTVLQQAVDTQVYGMKELQKYLEKCPNNNPRVQLQGNFCALFQHKNIHGHSGPEHYVEAVVEAVVNEALDDNVDRSLSPCRLVRDKMRYGIKNFQTWEMEDGRGIVFVIQPRTEDY